MKAHKLFAKEKTKVDDGANLDTLSEEVSFASSLFRAQIKFNWFHFHLVVVKTVVGQNGYQFHNHG